MGYLKGSRVSKRVVHTTAVGKGDFEVNSHMPVFVSLLDRYFMFVFVITYILVWLL